MKEIIELLEDEIRYLREVLSNLITEENLLLKGDVTQIIEIYQERQQFRKEIVKIRKALKQVEKNLDPSPVEISLHNQIKVLRNKILDQIHNNQAIKKSYNNKSCLPPSFDIDPNEIPKKRLLLEDENGYD